MGFWSKLLLFGLAVIVIGLVIGNEAVRNFGLTIIKWTGIGILLVIGGFFIFVLALLIICGIIAKTI